MTRKWNIKKELVKCNLPESCNIPIIVIYNILLFCREKERFKLEREMFSMMKSDERLQNLRAAKLRSYWQQICDREKSARERNDELLRDFKELEVKLAGMETQTKKLKGMKVNTEIHNHGRFCTKFFKQLSKIMWTTK